MSDARLGQAVGETGANPTLEEAEAKVTELISDVIRVRAAYGLARTSLESGSIELVAHRARVLSAVASDLMNAAFMLQHAAYEKATK